MQKDHIIMLAWPEGYVRAAGAWYDKFFSINGKYRVGHSAAVLINSKEGKAYYFDFGRYHTPQGYGRVRDEETDPDLALPGVNIKSDKIVNLNDILVFLSKLKSTHGEGRLYASVLSDVAFFDAYNYAKKLQNKGMVKYGPFVYGGTNCSRFTASLAISSLPPFFKKIRLRFPFCISPSPKRNVSILNNTYYVVDKEKVKIISKSKLKAYFSSIEI
ncbi:MAG: hypothetical protein CMD25_08655 [Flavobacteriales bacterium]|nr:hypothetical protein [Flavobacteriales bacterium]|tara:strand:+ start:4206 stop:4853 length:648 start_codon:yes stop_codon:yes gene_type:complete